uniref:Uncharacterized protein n=1 Tax=Amazona collaria TaxID=241587 RepID=A0A8B9FM51_9PSIT
MASSEEKQAQPFVDIFNEDEAEKSFLLSKPTCLIIFGKPVRCLIEVCSSDILLTITLFPSLQHIFNKMYLAGYVLSGFPSLSEEYTTVSQQVEKIKNLKLKPDFLINIKCSDYDLCQRISGQRQHPDSGQVYQRNQWDPNTIEKHKKKKGQQEEDHEEEEEEDEELEEEQSEFLHQLVQRPEDFLENAEKRVEKYKDIMLHPLEDLMAEQDCERLIEVDGNQQPDDLLVVTSDKNYICCSCCFNKQGELLRVLSSYQRIAHRYRWRRSRWGKACPVALKKGDIVMGNPDLAVSFLGKMYILSSLEALRAFMSNPRPYLLPPMPLPPCKVLVFGPPFSGRTTICNLIAHKYKGKVGMAEITADPPEVQAMVEATKSASVSDVTLPPEIYAEVLESLIKNNKGRFPGAPEKGGWVVDNYPLSADHWSALSEKGLLPDTVVCLKDTEKNETSLSRKELQVYSYLVQESSVTARLLESVQTAFQIHVPEYKN